MSKHTLPRLIGHRGAASIAPENTIEGFAIAKRAGLAWVECDVKLTRDGVPILMHDDTLERTTNGSGPVCDMLWEDIEALEAGSWFSEHFAGVGVPSLEQALTFCIDNNMGLNIEIKPCAGRDIDTTEAALDVVSRLIDDAYPLLLSSFSLAALETAYEMAPHLARGLLLHGEYPDTWSELAEHLAVSTLNINGRKAADDELHAFADYCEDHEAQLLAYTINDKTLAKNLFAAGVDAIFSDTPDILGD